MNSNKLGIPNEQKNKKIAIIGGGVIGSTTAWHIANLGYQVIIIDHTINQTIDYSKNLSGTNASLGILMGNVFKRSSGRSWRLRQRSMQLWPKFIEKLSRDESTVLKIETPLIQLASSLEESQLMAAMAIKRKDLGLEIIKGSLSKNLSHGWPNNAYGGVISHYDGRIDPIALIKSLMSALTKLKVKKIIEKVMFLKKETHTNKQWLIHLANSEEISVDAVVICTANGTEELIKPLGYSRPIEPILGQVLALKSTIKQASWNEWPAVLTVNGVNVIPYKPNNFLLGATLEPGTNASKANIEKMIDMKGHCPHWIKSAEIRKHWQGLRAKPTDRPAPLLESLENGLILNTAHFRNGILLAPACAEWVGNEIFKTI